MNTVFDYHKASGIMLDVYDQVTPTLKGGTIEDMADVLAALDHMKREIAEMYEQVKNVMADQMGVNPEYAHGDFTFEKKMGASRKAWDHKALARVVADRVSAMAIDLDTGEVLKTPAEMIADAFEFAGVSYWRVKELSKIGVNADGFCEVVDGKPNIIVRHV